VVSEGMILSETELELGEDASGIMVLDGDADPGAPLSEVLPVSEAVLDLELSPNRSDCLSVYGVAREVHAITGAPLAPPPWEADAEPRGEGEVSGYASVSVEAPDLCPRFTARVFTDVAMGPSPAWLKARLVAAGQRPVSNVVDITNYVMLITAQPLHAFDLDRVPGGEIVVRTAREGETMATLDGTVRRFDAQSVLVCDRDGPTGIAGIMGGQASEVSDQTSRVLLEVATWNGVNILRTSSMLGLRSEASTRFEKQLHPELAIRAQRIASRLIVGLCGARLVPGTIDEAAEPPAPHVVSLHGARLDSVLGIHIERDEAIRHLERLGFEVEPSDAGDLRAVVPVHRHYDVTREADLIEEVGRLHGFDRLPRTLPEHRDRVGGLSREQALRRRAEDVIADLGFCEIVAWAWEQFGDGLVLAASFQDCVLIDIALDVAPALDVVFCDTGFHFPETLAYVERVRARYRMNLRVLRPEVPREVARCGTADCCQVRKVEPLRRVLADKAAWLSGLRRVETPDRADVPVIGWDKRFDLVKVCPLAVWTDGDVAAYSASRELPAHPLTTRGYPSIGCQPTTAPITAGDGPRAGRWPGQVKTECGLHAPG
jgi:phosphoadenylyl-sulfate reductase (thioredoxin)